METAVGAGWAPGCARLALTLLLVSAFQEPKAEAQGLDARRVFSQSALGVVKIATPAGIGAGFLVNSDGWVVTNFHVIQRSWFGRNEVFDAGDIIVVLKDGRRASPGRVVIDNELADLDVALLRIHLDLLVSLPLLDSSDALVGEPVVAIGHPGGLDWTQTSGTISKRDTGRYIQTDVAINPGNSGGPLLNAKGQVVGMATSKRVYMELTGFALKTSILRRILRRMGIAFSTIPTVDAAMTPDERINNSLVQERAVLREEAARLKQDREKLLSERLALESLRIASAGLIARAEPIRKMHEEAEARTADVQRREAAVTRRERELADRVRGSRHLLPGRMGVEFLAVGGRYLGGTMPASSYSLGGGAGLFYRFDLSAAGSAGNRVGVSYSIHWGYAGSSGWWSNRAAQDLALVLDMGERLRVGVGHEWPGGASAEEEHHLVFPAALYLSSDPVPIAVQAKAVVPLSFRQVFGSAGVMAGVGFRFLRL